MPFFRFSLKKNFLTQKLFPYIPINNIKENYTYFSKNTSLWRHLNKRKNSEYLNLLCFEKRAKINQITDSILFCLPPNLGLGDVIEYCLFINNLIEANKFSQVGVAFVGRYKFFLIKYFNLTEVYSDVIIKSDIDKYRTVFHFTKEIKEFKKQKFIRTDIEQILCNYFNIKKKQKNKKIYNKSIKKISIFPISSSPIRSMPVKIINSLIKSYQTKYKIEIVLDRKSKISNYIETRLIDGNFEIIKPNTLELLCNIVKNIDYGIFMDSGPLHLSKLFQKRGLLIITTVSKEILLDKNDSIIPIKNNFSSQFCNAPCGLTNIFNYSNESGCYHSLNLKKNDFLKIKNLNSLQRGQIKDSYIKFMDNPVDCVNNIDIAMILKTINNNIL